MCKYGVSGTEVFGNASCLRGKAVAERSGWMGRKYIFTNKKESKKGIFSSVLGMIAFVSVILAVYGTFQNQGQALGVN